jgi:hypothetical protein
MLKSVCKMKILEVRGTVMNHYLMQIRAYSYVNKNIFTNLNQTYVNCLYLTHLNMIPAMT